MASFAQTLRSFNTGSLSREDLFATLERIISDERADMPWLLRLLEQEQVNVPMPQDVYDAVRQKIMEVTDNNMDKMNPKITVGEDPPVFIDEDLSRTQLATSFFQAAKDLNNNTGNSERQAAPENADVPADLQIKGTGDVLNGRFVLEERVGSGGMSTVYRAIDRRKLEADDRDPYVAVKILSVEFRAHPDSLMALQREAKKCHKLAHPNIVRAYDFDRDQSTVFMTMEYLSGHSLAKTLRNPSFKGLSCDEAMPIIEGMSEALAFAHKNGIVHADFKPANVILTDSGEVKVIDFGIARAFQKPGESDLEVTRFDPGSLGALTPTYASPEMLEHREPDPRDDVYALACITYEMLTGRHPFGRRQANEARDGGFALERKILTRKQWKALKSALEFDREKRTPSVEQFFKEIKPQCSRAPITAIAASSVIAVLLVGFGVVKYLDTSAPFDSLSEEETDRLQPIRENPKILGTLSAEESAEKVVVSQDDAIEQPARDNTTPAVESETAIAALPRPETIENYSTPESIQKSVMTVVNSYACSAMTASVTDGTVYVRGYINKSTTTSKLKERLTRIPGVTAIETNISSLTKPMCGVVELYRQYWISNKDNNYGTSIKSSNATGEFVAGEPLIVELTTPPESSFVNIDYYSLDGHVVHMLPSPRAKANQAPANYVATLGDLNQWIVSEPFGQELVVILTTPVSLFSDLRDEYEKAEDYLRALKKRLASIDNKSLKQEIAADFVLINTRPK